MSVQYEQQFFFNPHRTSATMLHKNNICSELNVLGSQTTLGCQPVDIHLDRLYIDVAISYPNYDIIINVVVSCHLHIVINFHLASPRSLRSAESECASQRDTLLTLNICFRFRWKKMGVFVALGMKQWHFQIGVGPF